MAFLGADTEALRAWAQSAATASQRINDVMASCQGAAMAAEWVGPDADTFREHVSALHTRSLEIAGRLNDRSADATAQAEAQDVTSADSGGTIAGIPLPPMTAFDPSAGLQDIGRALRDIGGLIRPLRSGPFAFLTDPSTAWTEKMSTLFHLLAGTGGNLLAGAERLARVTAADILDFMNTARRGVMDGLAEHVDDLAKNADGLGKISKAVSGFDTLVHVYDLGKALSEGRTGDAIGKASQIVFSFSPLGRTLSAGDAAMGLFHAATGLTFDVGGRQVDFSSNSPLDLAFKGIGNISDEAPWVKHAERMGQLYSDSLGLSPDGAARKAMSSGTGVVAFALSVVNPAFAIGDMIGWKAAGLP